MTDTEILEFIKNIAEYKTIDSSEITAREIQQTQPVYCVSVPSTAFVVKQNDQISVTGNCHIEGMIELFRLMIRENKDWWTDDVKKSIYELAEKMTELEIKFIDYVYDGYNEFYDLHKEDLKQYIRYIVDRRLISMGMKGIHKVKKNPLPWVDEMIASQNHESFFETRATSYAKGALTGSWADVWGKYNK